MSIIKVRCIIATQTSIPGAEISIVSYSIFLVFKTWAIVCWPFSIYQQNLVIDCRQLTWDTWPDLLISGVAGHKYPDTHNVAPGHGLGEKLVQNVLCFAIYSATNKRLQNRDELHVIYLDGQVDTSGETTFFSVLKTELLILITTSHKSILFHWVQRFRSV